VENFIFRFFVSFALLFLLTISYLCAILSAKGGWGITMKDFYKDIKQEGGTDEYITPIEAVEYVLPYVSDKKVWCPFDLSSSNYVKLLPECIYSHIETGQDFFTYEPKEEYDCIVSNPPFSKRNEVFERLFELDKPFMMLVNSSGIFDNRKRFEMFSKHKMQLLIPQGRVKYIRRSDGLCNSPMFQSYYVCYNMLPQDIIFVKRKD
jgi:hypothetical protein